jgi:quercetin dioxygenase-like cupin family protein
LLGGQRIAQHYRATSQRSAGALRIEHAMIEWRAALSQAGFAGRLLCVFPPIHLGAIMNEAKPKAYQANTTRSHTMKKISTLLFLAASTLTAQAVSAQEAPHAVVKPLMAKKLPDFSGKEGTMIEVEYPPGSKDPIHRHNAHAFVYVLSGSIVMQLKGGKEVTVNPGQTFYEGPDDVHTVGRNASTTKPAKFVVFLLKKPGAPILEVVK